MTSNYIRNLEFSVGNLVKKNENPVNIVNVRTREEMVHCWMTNLVRQIKKNLVIATAVATAATGAWYLLVNKPRKEAYAAFYANYDAEKDFQRMKALGVFQSQAMIEEKAAEGGDAEEEEE
eukprot:TRINITY_DN3239_c0_g1_i1.p1 TRINITY_DN3239_c0_g1~~TRINITY_DN3239_c0_g1_i1.p1  ORF type:complete len:121 (-),score=50.38 TRINITY_DN3239_c0_g1_i1:76-438(-)